MHTTLDFLAEKSIHFKVPLGLLRRTRELNWEALEICEQDRPAVLEKQRQIASVQLIAWLDAMETFGLLSAENSAELRFEVLDLLDDKQGKR